MRLEPIGPNEHLDWRLTNDSDAEIRGLGGMGFVLRFQRLDYDGQWVDYVLISRPPMIALTPPRVPIARVVAPHASVVVSESPLGRVPFAAGTYRVSVTYGDARYSSVDRFASAQFEIVGITTAQAQDALAALDQPQPQSCLPHDVLPRFVLVAPPPMAERLLELHNVTFENWYALFETGIDHARSWALLRAGARSPDGEIALAAASAAMVRTPRCEFADMAWRPLIDALDHRRQLPPEVVEALGGLMGCGHDRTIERRLINRIATGNDDERAAISAWLISRRPEDPSISDVALEMQASNALRTAARRTGSSCFRSYFRRSAQWLAERHPTALEPSELDCLDNAPTGCAVDPRLRPLLDAPFGLDQRVELR